MRIGKVAVKSGVSIIAELESGGWRDLTTGGEIITIGAAAELMCSNQLKDIAQNCPTIAFSNDDLLAPIDAASRILCTGFNFASHAAEVGVDVPAHPTFFSRFPSSFTDGTRGVVRPIASETFDWEGEVAFVIGKPGKQISKEAALSHVAAFAPMGEHSVREFQLHGTQATAGKNFDKSGALGPFFKDAKSCPKIEDMEIITELNGEKMQHGHLSDLIFDAPSLINYISKFMELLPGDVIATGTPPGIGFRMEPQRWLSIDDVITVKVPNVGTISNKVIAAKTPFANDE